MCVCVCVCVCVCASVCTLELNPNASILRIKWNTAVVPSYPHANTLI